MDPQSQFCHNTECPARGKRGLGNIGIHSRRERRYYCKVCSKPFAATADTPLSRLHKPVDTYFLVMVLLSHGCPPQACVAAFGLDERTVSAWMEKAGSHCEAVHKHVVAEGKVELKHVQADELWVKLVGRKVWMAMAVCATSRLWLGGVVSRHRDKQLVNALARLVRACASSPCVLICTDGLSRHRRGGNRLMPPVRHSLSIAGLPVIRTGVRRLVAFQNAAHAGGLVYEVSDPQAKDGWQDYRAVGEEMIG